MSIQEFKKHELRNLFLYFMCVLMANLSIVIMTLFIDTDKTFSFLGNTLYEFCNVAGLYIGIKALPFWKMISLHLIASSIGFILAQYIGTLIV